IWRPYGTTTLFRREECLQCEFLRLTAKEKVFSQLDGEPFETLPLTITIHPKAIQMILPKTIHQKYRESERKNS
ncbi:MAG: hypothetical protein ACK4TN_03035, partial [Brevinematales bacterium]